MLNIRSLFVLSLTFLIFYILFTRNNVISIYDKISQASLILFFVSLIFSLQMPFIHSLRLKLIFKSLNIDIEFYKLFRIILGSYPLVSVTPSRAGDFVRTYYLRKEVELSESAGSVISERIFDLISILLLSSFTLLSMGHLNYNILGLSFTLAIIIITAFSIYTPSLPIPEKFNIFFYKLLDSYINLLRQKILFLKVLSLSVLQWSLALIQTYVFS